MRFVLGKSEIHKHAPENSSLAVSPVKIDLLYIYQFISHKVSFLALP